MKEVALKSELFDVLKGIQAASFRVDQLTEAYLQHPLSLHTSKKAARQFVYRNMKRLIAAGHMERLKVNGRWPHYTLTPQFFRLHKSTKVASTPLAEASVSLQIDPLISLKERLQVNQAEVLTAMGEMEEYEAICQEMPELRDIVQPRYNESREHCSRLLGRIKALESLILVKAR